MTKGNTSGEEEIFRGQLFGKENEGQLFLGEAWRLFGD